MMNSEDFEALARRGAIDALKALAAIAFDPTAVASDRKARAKYGRAETAGQQ